MPTADLKAVPWYIARHKAVKEARRAFRKDNPGVKLHRRSPRVDPATAPRDPALLRGHVIAWGKYENWTWLQVAAVDLPYVIWACSKPFFRSNAAEYPAARDALIDGLLAERRFGDLA